MTQLRNVERNRLLEPLVKFAYEIYCGRVVDLPPPDPEPPLPAASLPLTEEFYRNSIERDIAKNYSFPEAGFQVLLHQARSGSIGRFTDQDCEEAINLLNTILVVSLEEENKTCGGPEAIAKVQAKVPGFSADFYKEVMDRMEYYNR